MMNPFLVLALQCSFSLLIFWLILKWHVLPKISRETKFDFMTIFLWINVFRYLPLSLFMPDQVSSEFPLYLKETVAYGDFLSSIFALIALFFLRYKQSVANPMIWTFSIVSIADMILVLTLAMKEKVYLLDLGANYFTVSIYVPLLIVIQTLILKILTSKAYA
ncbi:hypothetical protein ALPR1_07780 [Algoriphagus machipongonensis]|uniref:Uncharacterized protein n=2 Tax=Algoriphagus machipongonensis TaxID=388413 RepID=A3HZX2_9BACT|nr:hypothetical protein ALPR1_07780 [Algoriphagus machipongonensis]